MPESSRGLLDTSEVDRRFSEIIAFAPDGAEQFIAELERRASEGIREDFPVYEAAFDLLDDRGRYIGSIEGPGSFEETVLPAVVGLDGRLYTRVFEPFAQVRRYRLDAER